METWQALIVAAIINVAIVAYTYGRLSAKVEILTKLVERLCGEHEDIIVNKVAVAQQEKTINWLTRQSDAIWRAILALSRGEKVREYDPLDPNYPNRPPR